MTNEEAREHMDMLIAHKDKALETHIYPHDEETLLEVKE